MPLQPRSRSKAIDVYTPEYIKCPVEKGIFNNQTPASSAAGRTNTSVTLNPPSIPSASSSRTPSVMISFRGFNPSRRNTFETPMEEESVTVLEWIGFEPSTAVKIFLRYRDRADPEQNSRCLMDYVASHISDLWTQPYEDMEPKEAMARIGLCEQIQEAIVNPEFSNISWTASLYYWIKHTIETNYSTLLLRQKMLKDHAARLVARKREQA
ncbi:hypothetical protein PVAR5_5651 [Paecilomyces variotii No. 5]|uniref:Uncharacterized protein n=1 Tax=Byssochlamys spectabilis (strain No. 5 / NBRC 109023) TaxID=1356009 RepID=V5FY30_BYSSN|nr:hypothetical protein PVAR5_5651 [Paecilomyces variotii No. 5]